MAESFSRSTNVEISLKTIKWGIVVPGGWLVILVGAAIILPLDSRPFALKTVPLLALVVAWLLLTVSALGVYFYRAWRRLPTVTNKAAYAAWLSFQIACAIAAALMLASLFVPVRVTTLRQAREWTLQQNLHVMRGIINQYTLDKQSRPQSLNDLVEAGYLRQTPVDTMTRRNDTWVLEWSNDPKMPGIVNIRSGSTAVSTNGSAYHDW
jgi:general secretion pathway protein G